MVKFVNAEVGDINYSKCYNFFKSELSKADLDALYSAFRSAVEDNDYWGITDTLTITCNYDSYGRNFHIWVDGSDVIWDGWDDTTVLNASCDPNVDVVFNITDPKDTTKTLVLSALRKAVRDFLDEQNLRNFVVEVGNFEYEEGGSCYTYLLLDFNLIKQIVDTFPR